jgi:hypothetical protein
LFLRHSGEAFSTVPHVPKLRHIGQTVNALEDSPTPPAVPCTHLWHAKARDEALG